MPRHKKQFRSRHLNQVISDPQTKNKLIPIPTLKTSQFRSPTLTSSQLRPTTLKPSQFPSVRTCSRYPYTNAACTCRQQRGNYVNEHEQQTNTVNKVARGTTPPPWPSIKKKRNDTPKEGHEPSTELPRSLILRAPSNRCINKVFVASQNLEHLCTHCR